MVFHGDISDATRASINDQAAQCAPGLTAMTDPEFNVLCVTKPNANASYMLPEMTLSPIDMNGNPTSDFYQFSGKGLPRCEAPAQPAEKQPPEPEMRGNRGVQFDKDGNVARIILNPNEVLWKEKDGSWSDYANGKLVHKLENVQIDKQGNLEFDVKNDNGEMVHAKMNADGSTSRTTKDGTFAYDAEGRITEAPAGNGRQRQYHYDENGQLDSIEGNLGHWQREMKNGQVEWHNTTSGTVWPGDMNVDADGNLEYKGRNGADWVFTPNGKDIPVPPIDPSKIEIEKPDPNAVDPNLIEIDP